MEGGREGSGLVDGGRERQDEEWTEKHLAERVDSMAWRLGAIQNPAAWGRRAGPAVKTICSWIAQALWALGCGVVGVRQEDALLALAWRRSWDRGVLAVITECVLVTGGRPQRGFTSARPRPQAGASRGAVVYLGTKSLRSPEAGKLGQPAAAAVPPTPGPAGRLASPPPQSPWSSLGFSADPPRSVPVVALPPARGTQSQRRPRLQLLRPPAAPGDGALSSIPLDAILPTSSRTFFSKGQTLPEAC
ncbi:hypothetical protein VULLAG_LOCUS14641 [Vulpes lagopus]